MQSLIIQFAPNILVCKKKKKKKINLYYCGFLAPLSVYYLC